jgi:hypothetical protein
VDHLKLAEASGVAMAAKEELEEASDNDHRGARGGGDKEEPEKVAMEELERQHDSHRVALVTLATTWGTDARGYWKPPLHIGWGPHDPSPILRMQEGETLGTA